MRTSLAGERTKEGRTAWSVVGATDLEVHPTAKMATSRGGIFDADWPPSSLACDMPARRAREQRDSARWIRMKMAKTATYVAASWVKLAIFDRVGLLRPSWHSSVKLVFF